MCVLLNLFGTACYAAALEVEYFRDTTRADIKQALQHKNWQSDMKVASFGFVGEPYWLRYQLPSAEEDRVLRIDNSWILKFDVFLVSNKQVVRHYTTGSELPIRSRAIESSVFAFPISSDIDAVYIHDPAHSAINYPVTLTPRGDFERFNAALNVGHGMYYGIILLIIASSLALFGTLRDSIFLYYSIYASVLVIFLTTVDGTGPLLLWPETPFVHTLLTTVGWGVLLASLVEFSVRFLNLAERAARWMIWLRAAQLTTVAVAATSLMYQVPTMHISQSMVTIVTLAIILCPTAMLARSGSFSARVFLLAQGAMACCVAAMVAQLMGWLSPSIALQHSIHIGSFIELSIFAAALMRRLRRAQRARWRAYAQSRELTRRNKELRTAHHLAEEHRQLQKSIQQAQKLKTIGQMAGGFAHDFNNILASIMGFSELAQDPSAQRSPSKLAHYLQEIEHASQRGATLVKQLLTYSRNTPSEPQTLNFNTQLSEAVSLLRGSLPPTVEIDLQLPGNAVYLDFDPELLQQLLVNLSLNAAEAMSNRGAITITLREQTLENQRCTSCLNRFSGDFVTIDVADTGPGIHGQADSLFTPFHTSKSVGQGSGLGLSVVHGIVHERHGHVFAGNQARGGARFSLYLPQQPVPMAVSRERKRILLIEDEPSVARYLETLLDASTFETTVAHRPTDALENFVRDPNGFDLVITDHLMPNGTGLELAQDLHALRPELPIILTTGNANNIDSNELVNAGVDGVFEKPLNSEQLLAKIRGLLAV